MDRHTYRWHVEQFGLDRCGSSMLRLRSFAKSELISMARSFASGRHRFEEGLRGAAGAGAKFDCKFGGLGRSGIDDPLVYEA